MFSLLSYGEVLVDFLPDENALGAYRPMAGGAPANVAVAFAKLGGDSYFAGGLSQDNFGTFLKNSLADESVKLDYAYDFEHANTAMVLVSLDDTGERSFSFYRHDTADTQYLTEQVQKIDFNDIDIFHFCSNTLTNLDMYDSNVLALLCAKESNTLISFDVNLRQSLWSKLNDLPKRVEKCLTMSDLVKLSKEEAQYLADAKQMFYQDYIAFVLSLGVELILITDGPGAVQIVTNTFSEFVEVPKIKAVDTTAGGDSFIAGFLYSYTQQVTSNKIDSFLSDLEVIKKGVVFASKCGAHTCQKKGAFAALPTLSDL